MRAAALAAAGVVIYACGRSPTGIEKAADISAKVAQAAATVTGQDAPVAKEAEAGTWLGFDVYTQAVDRTVDILRQQGIDLSKVSRATWEGRPAFVVGALAGDSTSKQFWVDAERLLFVRLMETAKTANGPRRDEYRFLRYVPHGQAWVAEEVIGLRAGKPSLHEIYANVRVDVPLDDATFDPAQYATFTPWYRR